MAMALIIFNIVWKSNKIIKASSPWLNAVLLVGIIIWLPSALFNSLAVSSIEYGFEEVYSNALCHLEAWFYYVGEAIFLATMIAKNWRIYRIFSNKSLKMIGDELSDYRLVMFILLLLLPVLIILIVWSSFHIQLETPLIQNQNPQLIRIAVCTSDYLIKFRITLRSYMAILLLVLFVLTFLVLRTTMSAFRREGTLSFVVMSVALFPLPVMDVIHTIATTGDLFAKTMVHLWIEFTQGVLFPLLIMSVLFLPNVYLVLIKERLETGLCITKKEEKLLASDSEELSSRYHSLKLQAASLREQLYEADQLVAQCLQHKQYTLNEEDSSDIMQKNY